MKITPKATEYNPDIVKRMTSGNSKKKRFDYFLTIKYARLFAQKLNLTDLHEVYWGNNEEMKMYSEDLFYYLLEDMKHDPLTRNNILSLLELKTKEDIYNAINTEFIEIFYQFTKGVATEYHDYDIVEEEEHKPYSPQNERLKFSDIDTLTFKKIGTNIEIFAQRRLYLVLTGLLVNIL